MQIQWLKPALGIALWLACAGSAVSAEDAPGCPMRALNVAQLKAAPGVQSVVVDASGSRATLIFANGDVLRMGTSGCVIPMLAARLWIAGDDALSDEAWLEHARAVAALALTPVQYAQVGAALAGNAPVMHVDGGLKLERALDNGAGFSLTVVRTPRDTLGASLSMVFRKL